MTVVAVSVVGSIASLNVALTLALRGTAVAPEVGLLERTVGTVEPSPEDVPLLELALPDELPPLLELALPLVLLLPDELLALPVEPFSDVELPPSEVFEVDPHPPAKASIRSTAGVA